MPTLRPTGVRTPDGGDPFSDLVQHLLAMGLTSNRTPSVASEAEAQSIVDALAATAYPATSTDPLTVYRSDLLCLMVCDGSTWQRVGMQIQTGRQSVSATSSAKEYSVSFPTPFSEPPTVGVFPAVGNSGALINGSAVSGTVTASGFTLRAATTSGTQSVPLTWLAIGY